MDNKKSTDFMLAVVYVGAFLAAFNANIVSVALPGIGKELAVNAATSQWLVSGYMMIQAIVIAVYAYMSKRFSTRTLFFSAAALFAIGQLGCLASPNFPALLAFRFLQACGGGVLIPIMMGTILTVAPRDKLGSYLAKGTACITLGPALASVLSGIMTTGFGWRAVFVIPLVIVLVIMLLGITAIKSIGEIQKVKIDIPSVILIALVLSSFVLGVGRISADPVIGLIILAISISGGAVFVLRQNKIKPPFLDIKPMRSAIFSVGCILLIFAIMQNFSMSLLLPMFFQNVFAMTALEAGLLLIPPILLMAAATLISGRIMDKYGVRLLLPIGFLILLAGQILVAFCGSQLSIVGVVTSSVLVYGGAGLVQAPIQTTALKTLTPRENSSGVSLINVFIQSASAIGPAMFMGILSNTVMTALNTGASDKAAQAQGFVMAVTVAAVIAAIGVVVSALLVRKVHR